MDGPRSATEVDVVVDALTRGDLTVVGQITESSNIALLCAVEGAAAEPAAALTGGPVHVIYKPVRGERPLWDFPHGVYQREAAAWELSEILGWSVVPETLLRQDAPLGPGSLQRFVDADFSEHYFTLMENPTHHDQLRVIAVFDLLLNNADRKSGHCLLDADGRIWAIDNGLSFHVEPKLRTVIWDFAGEPFPTALRRDLTTLLGLCDDIDGPLAELRTLLNPRECAALRARVERLLDDGAYPNPTSYRSVPWPSV